MKKSLQARRLCAIELVLTAAVYLLALWFITPRVADAKPLWMSILLALFAFAALWILWVSPRLIHRVAHLFRGAGPPRTFFLRTEALGRSARNFGLITALGLAALLVIRLASHPAAMPVLTWKLVVVRFASYVPYALVQAIFYFEFCQPRFQAAFGERAALWGTALTFSLFHCPNLSLMGLGLVASYFWAREYLRQPNLVLLTLSHAILGSCLLLVSGIMTRIGPFYLHPEKHALRTLLPWWQSLVQGLW